MRGALNASYEHVFQKEKTCIQSKMEAHHHSVLSITSFHGIFTVSSIHSTQQLHNLTLTLPSPGRDVDNHITFIKSTTAATAAPLHGLLRAPGKADAGVPQRVELGGEQPRVAVKVERLPWFIVC